MKKIFWLCVLISLSSLVYAGDKDNSFTIVGIGGGGTYLKPSISPFDHQLMMVHSDMSGVYCSEDGAKKWTMLDFRSLSGCLQTGGEAYHPTDPNTIYSASANKEGGVKVSHDRGKTWEMLGAATPWGGDFVTCLYTGGKEKVAILAGTEARYSGATPRIWMSADEGQTWTQCLEGKGPAIGFFMDKKSAYVCTASGIFRSDDNGKIWQEKNKGLAWLELKGFGGAMEAKTGKTVFYCTITSKKEAGAFKGGVYRSQDRADSWQTDMGEGMNTSLGKVDGYGDGDIAQYGRLALAENDPETVYVSAAGTGYWPPKHRTIYRTVDGGQHWAATLYYDPRHNDCNLENGWMPTSLYYAADANDGDGDLSVCRNDADIAVYATGMALVLTNDGGKTWHQVYTRQVSGNKPPDKDSTWTSIGAEDTTTWKYVVDPFDPNRTFICYTDIGMAASSDGGQSWKHNMEGVPDEWHNTTYDLICDPQQQGVVWAGFSSQHDLPHWTGVGDGWVGKGGVCKSTDHGATWVVKSNGLPDAPVKSLCLDKQSPVDSRTLYAVVYNEGVYKSTDGGENWVKKSDGLANPQNMHCLAVTMGSDHSLFCVVTAKRKGGDFFAYPGSGLYRSQDSGDSWEYITASNPLVWPTGVAVDPRDSKMIYLSAATGPKASQGGVYKTVDGGKTWTRMLKDEDMKYSPYLQAHTITLDPDKPDTLFMGSDGQGMMWSKDGGAHWEELTGVPFACPQQVTFDPQDPTKIYIATFGGGVWKGNLNF